jgi:arylsulfatase A-like enzyme
MSSPRLAASLLCIGLAACAPEPVEPLPDRDVVLIVIDTLRADRLGCYGHDRDTSPTLDALAASGVRCADVTAQSSWTAPSMVSLMLSRQLGADFVRMPELPTLAERLADLGYRCVAFQDNMLLAPGTGFDRGFESYEVEAGPNQIMPALARDDPRPLFAYFHFVDPHDPYAPLPKFDRFEPRELDDRERARLADRLEQAAPELDETARAAELARAQAVMREERALYEGDVLQTDERVNFALSALLAQGRRNRALVIVAADHGECLYEQPEAPSLVDDGRRDDLLHLMKRTHNSVLYQSLVGTPLIISGPDIPAGVVLERPVSNLDVVPTILDWLGLPLDDAFDGRSLLPAMAAAALGTEPPDVGHGLRFANTSVYTSVTDADGLKLMLPWTPDGPDEPLLFDLAADPHERAPLPLDDDRAARLVAAVEDYRRTALMPSGDEGVVDDAILERFHQLGYVGGWDDPSDPVDPGEPDGPGELGDH